MGPSVDNDSECQEHYTIDVALCNVETPIAYATFVLPSRSPQHRCVYYDVDPCTVLDEYHVIHRPQAFLDPSRKAPKVFDVLRTPEAENPEDSSPANADYNIPPQSSSEPNEITTINLMLTHSYGSPSSSSWADESQDAKSSEASTPEKKGQVSNPTTPSSSVVSTPEKMASIFTDSKIHTLADIVNFSSQSLRPIEKSGSIISTHPSAEASGDKKDEADTITEIDKKSTVTDSEVDTPADALESSDQNIKPIDKPSLNTLARPFTKAQTSTKIKASKKSKAEKKRSQGSKIQESLNNLKAEFLQELGYPVLATANGNDYNSSPVTKVTASVDAVIEAPLKSELDSTNEVKKVAANSQYSMRESDLLFSQESFSVNINLPLKKSVPESTPSTLTFDAPPITEPSTATPATKKQKKAAKKAKKARKVGDDSVNAESTDQDNPETSSPNLTPGTPDTGEPAAIIDPARSLKDSPAAATLSHVASAMPDPSVQNQSGAEKSSPNLSNDVLAKAKSKKGRAGKKVKAKKEKADLKKADILSTIQTKPIEVAEHSSTVSTDMLSGSLESAPEDQLDLSVEDAEVQAGKDNKTVLDAITERLTPPESPKAGNSERVEHNRSEDITTVVVSDKDKKPEDHAETPSHVVRKATDPQLDGVKPSVSIVSYNPNRLLSSAEASVDSEMTESTASRIEDTENHTSKGLIETPDLVVITTNSEEMPAVMDATETLSDTEPFPEVDRDGFDEDRAQEENRARKESLLPIENLSQNENHSSRTLPQGVSLTCGEMMAWLRGEGKYAGQIENPPPYMELTPIEQFPQPEDLPSIDPPVHLDEHASSDGVGQSQGVPEVLTPGDSQSVADYTSAEKVAQPQYLNQNDMSIHSDNHVSNDDITKTEDVAEVSTSSGSPSVADVTTKGEIYNPEYLLLPGETSWFLETTKSRAMGDTNEEKLKSNSLGKEYLTRLTMNPKQKNESDKFTLVKQELEELEGQPDGSHDDTTVGEDDQLLGQASQDATAAESIKDIRLSSRNTQQEIYNPKCLLMEGESSFIMDKMKATEAGVVDYSELQPKIAQSANDADQPSQAGTAAEVHVWDSPPSSADTQQESYNLNCTLKEGESSWFLDNMKARAAGNLDYSELQPKVEEPAEEADQTFQNETISELPGGGSVCPAIDTQQEFHNRNFDYSELQGNTAEPALEAETAPEPLAEGSPLSSTSTQKFYNPNCLLQGGESSWFLDLMKAKEVRDFDYSELQEKTLEPAPQYEITPDLCNDYVQSSSVGDVNDSQLKAKIVKLADDGEDLTSSEGTASKIPAEDSPSLCPSTQEIYNTTCLFKNGETSWIFEKMKATAADDLDYAELQPKIVEPANSEDQHTSPKDALVESPEHLEDLHVVTVPKDIEHDELNKLTSLVNAVAECLVPSEDLSLEVAEAVEHGDEHESISPDDVVFDSCDTSEDSAVHEAPEEMKRKDENHLTSSLDATVEFESPVPSENLFDYKIQEEIVQDNSHDWSNTEAVTTISHPPVEIPAASASPIDITETWSVDHAVETTSQPPVADPSPAASPSVSTENHSPEENSAAAAGTTATPIPTVLQSLQAIDIIPLATAIQQDPTNKFLILQLLLVLAVRFVLLFF